MTLSSDVVHDIVQFCEQQLLEQHYRADYLEFLNLVLIFIGHKSKAEASFRTPGAFHHARWMAKAIYCLKIYMFREQFRLTIRETNSIRAICQFIVRLYVKAWFTAPLAVNAPNFDLKFLIDLHTYRDLDKDISSVAVKKMCDHLWYLSEEAAGLSFFDETIPFDIKREMVQAIRAESLQTGNTKKNVVHPQDVGLLKDKTIQYFVSKHTETFFTRFGISTQFMDTDPSMWHQCPSYNDGLQIAKKIAVINDVSERKVKLMEEFNNVLTHDEEQRQFVLLTVDRYRKMFPNYTKQSLISS